MDRLIDSSVLIQLERRAVGADLIDALEERGGAISVVTASELLHGVHRAGNDQRARRRSIVERMLAIFDSVPIDLRVARVHSELWAELVSVGEKIDSHDLWLAATAVAHDFEILTLNTRDFERVPGLKVARF